MLSIRSKLVTAAAIGAAALGGRPTKVEVQVNRDFSVAAVRLSTS